MKVGILTFHDADNYGAVLQAYALQETIKKLGCDVEIINYKQPNIINNYKVFSLRTDNIKVFGKSLISSLLHFGTRIKKKENFNNFRKNSLNLSKTSYHNPEEIKDIDIYIVGSDQVWNNEITQGDKTYFLYFCNGEEKKISYAASVGRDSLTNSEILELQENLSNFTHVSVREDCLQKTLSDFIDKPISHVLDPVLLADENIWNSFKYINSTNNKRYLLLYRLVRDEKVMEIAELISKRLNLEVYYINNSSRNTRKGFRNISNLKPEEFVDLFRNASFVVTNSFHGTAFSVLFNKNFVTIPHKTRGSRMISLLKLLSLDTRIITNPNQLDENYNLQINYDIPNELLNVEKNNSLQFLQQSIGS